MIRTTFVMEQHIGHRSYYQNLRRFIDTVPQIDATWVEVTYQQSNTLWEHLPLLPTHIRSSLAGRAQVRQGLRQRTDVALFNTQVPAALGGKMLYQQPYILCTDITPLQYDQMGQHYGHQPDRNALLKRYKHHINKKVFQAAARIFPWSTWVRDSLINDYGVAPDSIEVIPPGVDTDRWRPNNHSHKRPLQILFVGGDFFRKGGDDLLAAFDILPTGMAELILVTRSTISEKAGITVYKNMKPNSPDLISLCQTCDVFVLPTKAEAFGIAAVEASAIGLPIIAAAVGGLTDIVTEGKTGFLIQPGDIQSLAVHLQTLAENEPLRKQLGQASRQKAMTSFDAQKNALRISKILQDVAEERVVRK